MATTVELWRDFGSARSKRGRKNRAEFAELVGSDLETVDRWEKQEESIPIDVLELLYQHHGYALVHLMGWRDAPRSAIPESLRDCIIEESAARAEVCCSSGCESLLRGIEWRLRDEIHLIGSSPELMARLQRLRSAVLAFVSEPLEA